MVEINKNEVLLRDRNQWLHFSDPHKVILADSLDKVIPALAEVEELVESMDWYAAGFLSYESALAFDPALQTGPSTRFPYLWFGLYPMPATINLPPLQQPPTALTWTPTIARDAYNTSIVKIKDYIAQGKTYQVNYTMRLKSDFHISAWDFFIHLTRNQNEHAAYIDTGQFVICSASPELFFELDGNIITCRPMKGTVKRGRTSNEDKQQSDWLKHSEKNRAENVMIVDMIRNDLGRIARTGSVQVPELFCTERYPTLWQMTSTVTAMTNSSHVGIFRALFPCASITGAPKVSTMKIIHELETTPRNIYTGSIGYIFPGRKSKFNVAIRTALIDQEFHQAEYGVGGGIVWDSTSNDEYAEALLKARVLTGSQLEFSLLETLLWTPDQGYYLLDKHLDRLLDSAEYFDFKASRDLIEKQLSETSADFSSPQRVRMLVDQDGNVEIETTPFPASLKELHAHVARDPVHSSNIFLFHKSTHRDLYDQARAGFPQYDDVLLYNERNELTEFTIGNLVVEINGQLLTPPIECGVLPGTFRAHLLETGQISEKVLSIDQLKDCTKIYRINSVRKWEPVELKWK